jgi:DNA-binding response OmpR family regulator
MHTTRKALIVDDAMEFRLLLGSMFRELGLESVTVRDGETALAMAREERPAIICVDLMLPTLSGLEVCAALRRRPETADVPIVMVSARRFPQDRAAARRAGADAYVTKPVDRTEFSNQVRSLLWQRQQTEV